MGQLTDIPASEYNYRHLRCPVARLLNTLDEDDQQALGKVLDPDSGVQHTAISRLLRDRLGLDLTANSIQRHRRRDCRCA